MADLSRRTTQEVVEDHLALRKRGAIDEDLARNFADDVVLPIPGQVLRGRNRVRELGELLQDAVNDPGVYSYDSLVCEGDVALLEWSAEAGKTRIAGGVDTFVVHAGLICAQTIRYSMTRDLESGNAHPGRE